MQTFDDPRPHKLNSKQALVHILQVQEDISVLLTQGYINKNISMKDFTEYEYQMYSCSDCGPNTNIEYIHCSQPDQIRKSNIFVLTKVVEYKYQILCIHI